MRRILSILSFMALAIAFSSVAMAQAPDTQKDGRPDRKEWFRQMRQYKHDFMIRELSLSKEQQDNFFPIYDKMEDEVLTLQRTVRGIERAARKKNLSDVDYLKNAKILFEAKSKEGIIEEMYFDKFKEVLTPEQLYKLKIAERKFTQELMREHAGKIKPPHK